MILESQDSFLCGLSLYKKAELLKKEFHRKTSMFFVPFIVGFHYSENQSGNGAQNFLMPPRSLDKSLWEVPSESFQCRLDDTLTWASDNCHKKIGNGSATRSLQNPFDIALWVEDDP